MTAPERKGVDGTGKAARQARRNVRRAEARQTKKHHGTPIPDPQQTTRMVIPEHIRALSAHNEETS